MACRAAFPVGIVRADDYVNVALPLHITRVQILKMEHLILKVLRFDMGGVTAFSFHQRYIQLTNADDNVKFLAMVPRAITPPPPLRARACPPITPAPPRVTPPLLLLLKTGRSDP